MPTLDQLRNRFILHRNLHSISFIALHLKAWVNCASVPELQLLLLLLLLLPLRQASVLATSSCGVAGAVFILLYVVLVLPALLHYFA